MSDPEAGSDPVPSVRPAGAYDEPGSEAAPLAPPAGARREPTPQPGPALGVTVGEVAAPGSEGRTAERAAGVRPTLWGHDPANVGLLAGLVVILVLLAGAVTGFPGAREFLITGLLLVFLLAGGAWQRRKR